MSEWMSDREPNTEEEKPRFNRSKVVRIVISILVAIAMWLYVDLERAPERTMTIRDIPVEFSGENTTLADKNLMLFMAAPGTPENSTASSTSLVVSTGTLACIKLVLVRMLLFSTGLPS